MTSLETYLQEMTRTRPVAVKETSYYNALANLFNEVGKSLKPKVRYVITPAGQGAGLPDGGLYTAQQPQRNVDVSPATTPPERGCVEAKGLREDVLKIAEREQVQKYLERYRQVLVTNYRDFLLLGLDEQGNRKNLERYTLAESEKSFWELAAHRTMTHQQPVRISLRSALKIQTETQTQPRSSGCTRSPSAIRPRTSPKTPTAYATTGRAFPFLWMQTRSTLRLSLAAQ